MVKFEVFQQEEKQCRNGLDNNLLVSVHINAKLHTLEDSDAVSSTYKLLNIFVENMQYVSLLCSVSVMCACVCTYGISSGRTSARMLMESVLALEVGAAARRSFNRAI